MKIFLAILAVVTILAIFVFFSMDYHHNNSPGHEHMLNSLNDSSKKSHPPEITVYKSAQCGCCGKWVKHLEENGFSVKIKNTDKLNTIKEKQGIPKKLASCHTALVDGYIVEGHVPAQTIKRMLIEKPNIKGISVPGMPIGSPGMEGDYISDYDVFLFDKAGNVSVYEQYHNK